MKILWVKSDLLHPTTKGGHIRTLETLRRLHERHEIHYAAFDSNESPEGVSRSSEYCARLYTVPHKIPSRASVAFAAQLVHGLFSPLPVAILRYRSAKMARLLDVVIEQERFDTVVCDFITPAINLRSIEHTVLFQHNVETMIWRRHAENARTLPERLYLDLQARRMFDFERRVCQRASHVIAVSNEDARLMQEMFGIERVSPVPTGVDVQYFTPPDPSPSRSGLVFVGSMDWLPNIDGVRYFCEQILPIVRREQPRCHVTIVGRRPTREILALAEADPLIHVTGTVADVRPYLWESAVSIVPLRIGGGTRMKIYEAMAARTPVVSTTIGAEGLAIHPPEDIRVADSPDGFALECLALLRQPEEAGAQSCRGWDLVARHFGWDTVARQFETILSSTLVTRPTMA